MRQRSFAILILLFCRIPEGVGQGRGIGAESAAQGGICAVLQNPWSAAGNPAGLAGFRHLALNTSLQQNYLMPEIGNYALAISVPVRKGTLGVLLHHYGFASYLAETLGIAYGFQLSGILSAGTGLYYFLRRVGEAAQPVHSASYSLGLGIKLNDRIRIGFAAFNPFNTYFTSETGSELPAIFMLGICYSPSPVFDIRAEIRKDLDYPAVFMIGCEFLARDKLSLRGGISMFPASFSVGSGIRLKKIKVEIAAYYHEYLGFTPCSSLQYILK